MLPPTLYIIIWSCETLTIPPATAQRNIIGSIVRVDIAKITLIRMVLNIKSYGSIVRVDIAKITLIRMSFEHYNHYLDLDIYVTKIIVSHKKIIWIYRQGRYCQNHPDL